MIKVMIVDDQRLIREGLRKALELTKDIKVVSIADNGRDALEKIAVEQPDVVLMDIRMPILDGVECTRIIKQRYPRIKVLVLSTFDEDKYIIDALRFGAEGYLLKNLPLDKLVDSIRDVYDGSAIMQPEIAAKVISHVTAVKNLYESTTEEEKNNIENSSDALKSLTQRERDILRLVAKGLSNKEIAKILYISEGTVKNYMSTIYDKLGVKERSELILYVHNQKQV